VQLNNTIENNFDIHGVYKEPSPLMHRSYPELFATTIVGVQSMSAPVGLAFAKKMIYGDHDYTMRIFDEHSE